jgi:hypothetical protein
MFASRPEEDAELPSNGDSAAERSLVSVAVSADSTSTVSTSSSSWPKLQQETWPNIAFRTYEIVGYNTILQGGMDQLYFLPILHSEEELADWNSYVSSPSNPAGTWIDTSRDIYSQSDASTSRDFPMPSENGYVTPRVMPYVYHPLESTGSSNTSEILGGGFPAPIDPTTTPPPYLPSWQVSPPPNVNQTKFINMDMYRIPFVAPLVDALMNPSSEDSCGLFSRFTSPPTEGSVDLSYMWRTVVDSVSKSAIESTESIVTLSFDGQGDNEYSTVVTTGTDTDSSSNDDEKYYVLPRSIFAEPVFDLTYGSDKLLRGVILASINWDVFLTRLMFRSTHKRILGSPDAPLIDIVLRNECDESYTFRVLGPEVSTYPLK